MCLPKKQCVLRNTSLLKMNSWRVGGSAEMFFQPKSLSDLVEFLQCFDIDCDINWLGLGSNLLIRDQGMPGLVIHTLKGLISHQLSGDIVMLQAGMTCAKAARVLAKAGFAEAAFLIGIPGTMGGAMVMNAGAFGGETWSYLRAVDTIDRQGTIRHRDASTFSVGYRRIAGLQANEWIVAGYFEFPRGDADAAMQHMQHLLQKRRQQQPIGEPSCGSVFRNPTGDYAARLIEACGLKGMHIGGACVSPKHANFIVNTGNATATDIESLMQRVKNVVHDQCSVMLEYEVHIKGVAAQ